MSDDAERVPGPRERPAITTEPDDRAPEFAVEYTLDDPIISYGERVKVLKMRKPTGLDLIQIGNPVAFYPHVEPARIEHDMPKMIAMIARLSGVPSSSIERIGPRDLVGLAWAISPFFIPAA